LELITVQVGCSALAYTVYQASSTVVLAIGAVIVLTWLALLWTFLRMPEPTGDVAAEPVVVAS